MNISQKEVMYLKKNKEYSSSINVGSNNKFGNGNVIGNNNEIVINQGNSVTYEGDKENTFILEIIAPFLIKKYGKQNVGIVGLISLVSGFITIMVWMNSASANKLYTFLPDIETLNPQWVLYLSISLLILGLLLLSVLTYHSNTQCKKCKKEFAYDESKDPKIEEVKTSRGTRVKTTRYYQCKFCGHEDTAVSKENLEKSGL